jgi:hypothetical protein
VPVPEAAVHKNHGRIAAENYVWAAGQILLVKAKPEACPMQR